MEAVTYVVSSFCVIFIDALQLAMLIRAILSWFPLDESKFETFLYAITEPIIYPARVLFNRFDSTRNIPLDIPFFATYILLTILSTILTSYG